MYQPSLARFQSRDPLSGNGIDLLTDTGFHSNRLAAMRADAWFYGGNSEPQYAYARANPVNWSDPSGLFCRIRVHVSRRFGFAHYGLSVTDSRGQYEIDGAPDQGVCSPSVPAALGCSTLRFYQTPGYNEDLTGLMWDSPDQTCVCLSNYFSAWNNGTSITYSPSCANSNWALKCMLNHCGLDISWGWFSTPVGWNCEECIRYREYCSAKTGIVHRLCAAWAPKQCP
jgi:hypothetical protein